MMYMCGLIEGSVRLVLVPLICGQVSITATCCRVRLFSRTGSVDNRSLRMPGSFRLDVSCSLIRYFEPPVGTEAKRVGSSTAPFFSGASPAIPSTWRAYIAESGAAVTPCSSTLSSTVSATTASI